MKHGKNINIYLMDGDVNQRYEVILSNWNITSYKIPNNMISKSSDLTNIHTAGVYFLFNKTKRDNFVYVGESEDVHKRLTQHTLDKDGYVWYSAVVFVSNNIGALDKAKIKYLENRLYNIIKNAGSYQLRNRNEPRKSKLTRYDEDSMEAVIDNIELVVPVLGYSPFKKSTNVSTSVESDDKIFYIKRPNFKASCAMNDDGTFTLLGGSQIREKETKSVQSRVSKIRHELFNSDQIKNNILQKDIVISSSSAAAGVVLGSSRNGNVEWKTADGIKLGDLRKQ